jgi:hypothetical protein
MSKYQGGLKSRTKDMAAASRLGRDVNVATDGVVSAGESFPAGRNSDLKRAA